MPFFIRLSVPAEPVEAQQWFPGQHVDGVNHESAGHPGGEGLLPLPPHAYLVTGKQRLTVFAGDWIITEPTSRRHICKDDLFQRSYLPVESAAAVD